MRCYSLFISIRFSSAYDIGTIVINNITTDNEFSFVKHITREKALEMIATAGLPIEKDEYIKHGFVARKMICKIVKLK